MFVVQKLLRSGMSALRLPTDVLWAGVIALAGDVPTAAKAAVLRTSVTPRSASLVRIFFISITPFRFGSPGAIRRERLKEGQLKAHSARAQNRPVSA